MRIVFLIVVLIAAGTILFEGVYLGIKIWHSKRLVEKAIPFSIERGNAGPRILIVGDSLGVGVGASSPEHSLAGLIASEYPEVSIDNRSVSGAKISDALAQLAPTENRYDLVYIHVGANDVIGFTNLAEVQKNAEALFKAAKEKSDSVIIMQSGSVGFAPIFPQPLDWLYIWRTKRAYVIVQDEAAKAGVVYVDLYRERSEDPFLKDPDMFFADDGLHPTDEGYRAWFDLWQKAVEEEGWLEK